jgi:hemolysin activation/secretion protein
MRLIRRGRRAAILALMLWTSPALAAHPGGVERLARAMINAAWVRRQFDLNRIVGGGAGRAVALTQLINRAFLTAGFVNSGLLSAPDPAPDRLSLRLVHGRLVAPSGAEQAIAVTFLDDADRGLHPGYLRDRMPAAGGHPLSAAAIEHDFRLLAEDPALRSVTAQLLPGARPGEASLALAVRPRERADLYLTAGNSRSPTVGGERLGAGAYVRNLLGSGDLLNAEAGATRGLIDVSLGYSTPLFDPATTFSLRASYNEAAVIDAPLQLLDIETDDRFVQASLLRQLLRTPLTPVAEGRWAPSQTLSVGLGVAYRHQRSFLLGQPFSFAPGSVDGRAEYTALRLLGDYIVRNVDQVFAVSATGTIGLGGTRATAPGTLSPDRHFLSLLVQLNYARRLNGSGLELRARVTGQIASSTLYSGERLSIGGDQNVRGYRETSILADQGLVGSVELAQPFSLSGEAGRGRAFDWGAFSIAAFVDAGLGRNVEPPDPNPTELASVGAALTWQPSDALTLRLAYGVALVDPILTGTRDLQDDGVHLRLTLYPLRLLRGR